MFSVPFAFPSRASPFAFGCLATPTPRPDPSVCAWVSRLQLGRAVCPGGVLVRVPLRPLDVLCSPSYRGVRSLAALLAPAAWVDRHSPLFGVCSSCCVGLHFRLFSPVIFSAAPTLALSSLVSAATVFFPLCRRPGPTRPARCGPCATVHLPGACGATSFPFWVVLAYSDTTHPAPQLFLHPLSVRFFARAFQF